MRRKGLVAEATEGYAVVLVRAEEGCGDCGCGHSKGCRLLRVKARDELGVQAGQTVELEMPEGGVVLAALALFLVPLAALIAGMLVVAAALESIGAEHVQAWSIVGGFVCLGLSLFVVRAVDRWMGRSGKAPRVLSVTEVVENQ